MLLQRNRPGWFQDESTRRPEYSQGRIIEHTDEQVSRGRYLDQPSEETPLRSAEAEADVENEQTR